MWIMVDVVMNHAGCLFSPDTYGSVVPFNKEEHYHKECYINNWNNQWEVENCRLACLIDLKQEDPWVEETLLSWAWGIIDKYDIDGFRVDTIPEVPKWFWTEFTYRTGVYSVGEVLNGNAEYVGYYQYHLPGLLNYPLWYTLLGVYGFGDSMFGIWDKLDEVRYRFKDTHALGVFVDNHDNQRFLSRNEKWEALQAYMVFSLFCEGIPIYYYGTEQGFKGGNDP